VDERGQSRAWRLFIAVPLPDEVRTSLWGQLAPYRRQHGQARWVAPSTWHLTLLFLGSVPPEQVPSLVALAESVAAASPPAHLGISGGGGRVRKQEGVAWLAVAAGAQEMLSIADRLAAACPDGITVTAPPRRTPSAHLTVARRADRALVEALNVQRHGPLEATWHADRIALVRSHLGPRGSRYETLHEAALYAAGT
jgi:2'-5' RNA ligase